MSPESRLQERATALGFSHFGIASATPADSFHHYESWLHAGRHGEMTYLEKSREQRRDPSSILTTVRSVVMLAVDYESDDNSPIPINHGRIARYARGPDYHRELWDRLNQLVAWLMEDYSCEAKGVADTGPLLERDFAQRAGLGWIGKNTMLIHPQRGSYFMLGALLTSLDLIPSQPLEVDHCGTCTACIDACPTHAIEAPRLLNANKCISYLTIESRSAVPDEFKSAMGHWLFGCDVCQEVCPWNRFANRGPLGLASDQNWISLDAVRILELPEECLRYWIKTKALNRTKPDSLRRNAAVVLGNSGDSTAIPALLRLLNHPHEPLRDAAEWAIAEITNRTDHQNKSTLAITDNESRPKHYNSC